MTATDAAQPDLPPLFDAMLNMTAFHRERREVLLGLASRAGCCSPASLQDAAQRSPTCGR